MTGASESAGHLRTRVVLLGTGTPNADPARSGPAVAVVVDERAYLVDFGPGVVRPTTWMCCRSNGLAPCCVFRSS